MDDKQRFTLLLVDDHPTNLLLLEKIIEFDLPEVRVLTASNAEDGLKLAKTEPLDGAFIDVQMPGMSGIEMCRELNRDPQTAGLPLVLMTAHIATPQTRAEGLDVGAYDFISQPISNVEMLARIKVMLRLCANERQLQAGEGAAPPATSIDPLKHRWISGLLLAGNATTEVDGPLSERLSTLLPELSELNEEVLLELLTSAFPAAWKRTFLTLGLLGNLPFVLFEQFSEIGPLAELFAYFRRHGLALTRSTASSESTCLSQAMLARLQARAEKEFSRQEQELLRLRAADFFRQQQQPSAALECLLAAAHYDLAGRMLGQNRAQFSEAEIASVLKQIPTQEIAASSWLSLLYGRQLLQQQDYAAADWLERAEQRFAAENDGPGQLLAQTQLVMLSVCLDGLYERWSGKLPAFRALTAQYEQRLSSEERLQVQFALGLLEFLVGADLSAVAVIVKSALAQAQREGFPARLVELNLLWAFLALQTAQPLVVQSSLEAAFKASRQTDEALPLALLNFVACLVLHAKGDWRGFQRQQEEAFVATGERGMLAPSLSYYQATFDFARGANQAALERLEVALISSPAARHGQLRCRLLQLKSCCLARIGEADAALAVLAEATAAREHASTPLYRQETLLFSGLCHYLLGQQEQAVACLHEGVESLAANDARFRLSFHAWLAVLLSAQNDRAAEFHRQAFFDQAARQKQFFLWGMTPALLEPLAQLCRSAEERQLLQPLLNEFLDLQLAADNSLQPLLSLQSLGTLELRWRDCQFSFDQLGGPARQMIALLLLNPKCRQSSEMLMSLVWPDSSSDKARSSFDVGLSRLRRLLTSAFDKRIAVNRYLVLERGVLSLQNMRIDSVLIEKLINEARTLQQRGLLWQAEGALRRIDELWQGEFMAGYHLSGEILAQRQYLHRLRMEQVDMLAALLQASGRGAEAIRLLQKGVQSDPTSEELVRRLLTIYWQQQDQFSADQLLENYRAALLEDNFSTAEIKELLAALVLSRQTDA